MYVNICVCTIGILVLVLLFIEKNDLFSIKYIITGIVCVLTALVMNKSNNNKYYGGKNVSRNVLQSGNDQRSGNDQHSGNDPRLYKKNFSDRSYNPLRFSYVEDHDFQDVEINHEAHQFFEKGIKPTFSHIGPDAKEAKSFSRIIDEKSPELPYHRRTLDFKKCLHWGQLKLLLTEIEFLTLVEKKRKELKDERQVYFVYAGSAPGDHIPYLAGLFPDVIFELYDPNDFKVDNSDQVHTYVQFFTDKEAKEWSTNLESNADKFIVFCSDIRTEPATQEAVALNMKWQYDWWQLMKPELAMFKFRLPWGAKGKTPYLKGEIYIQPFIGNTSTETRLIVGKDAPTVDYDNTKYESQIFYHNKVNRKMYYNNFGDASLAKDGYDCCYDCTCLKYIASDYIKTFHTKEDLTEKINEIISNTTAMGLTIVSQTYRQHNEHLQNLLKSTIEPCGQKNCQTCSPIDESRIIAKGYSRATIANFDKAKKQ